MSIIEDARINALLWHGEQKYGDKPYYVHLASVVEELGRMEVQDEEVRAAAWLHDVLEDTACTPEDLYRASMTPYTIALVDAVTDRPGKNRDARHVLTYPRIARMPDAVTLKLADRIANVRASLHTRYAPMYLREHVDFRDALVKHGGPPVGWDTLDNLMGSVARSNNK